MSEPRVTLLNFQTMRDDLRDMGAGKDSADLSTLAAVLLVAEEIRRTRERLERLLRGKQ